MRNYARGVLEDDANQQLEQHLSTCELCQSTLQKVDVADDELIQALRFALPDGDDISNEELQRGLQAVLALFQSAPAITGDRPDESASEPEFAPGDMIDDYRIVKLLGRGGMGAVYKAEHARLKRNVALKVLSTNRSNHPIALNRFEREMQALGRLRHPNVVSATDAGEDHGTPYLVMEFEEGVDLGAVLLRTGPLSIADACEAIRQAALGLQHAHEHGMVHRDIKPSNLLLTPRGTVKILDLGLARLREDHVGQTNLTGEGQVPGTLDYLAPERLAETTTDVDIRSDIYSLGDESR